LLASLAKSLHAAIQARNLCQNLPQTRQEEVFVATLLMELVPLLVLASPEEDAKALTQQLTLTATDEERNRQAEKLLGVSFSRLSRTLLKQWRIEGIVHEALLAPEEPGVQVRSVLLGAEISRTSLFGWDSPEFQDTLKRVGEFKVLSPEQTSKLLQTSADEAVQMVTSLGKAQMGRMIATRKRAAEWQASGAPESERKPLLEPNLSLQMRALQELSTTMTGDFNINQVFKLVLTGLQRGIGLERVVFALFSKSDLSFACKHVLGEGGERLKEAFVLRYVKSHQGFLHNLFEQDAGVWIDRQGRELLSRFLDGSIKGVTGADEFLIAPLSAKGRKVGLLYADMKVSDRALTAEQFQGFGMFLQQVRLALGILASRQETT
jgi:hypothetical protein